MRKWLIVGMLLGAVGVAGCADGSVSAPATGKAGDQTNARAEQAAQHAVDAVFAQVGGDATFRSFPRRIGTAPGVVGIGGPAPGATIPATFETKASALGLDQFRVDLIRRWGHGPQTTRSFLVDAQGGVHALGRTGDEPPQIP